MKPGKLQERFDKKKMGNIFAYGTLMCEDIMFEVSGYHLSQVHATLHGYARKSVRGEKYPAIVVDDEKKVDGMIYLDVPASAWDRLDRFEGEMYERLHVVVELKDGRTLDAETYVIHPDFLDHLDQSDWDFDNFMRNGKSSFQKYYKGYHSL